MTHETRTIDALLANVQHALDELRDGLIGARGGMEGGVHTLDDPNPPPPDPGPGTTGGGGKTP